MKDKLLIFTPFEEFHVFFKFNTFLWKIKDEFKEIIVACPPRAINTIQYATSFVTISEQWLREVGLRHPQRDVVKQDEQYKGAPARNPFYTKVRNWAEKALDIEEYEILYYCNTWVKDHKAQEVFSEFFHRKNTADSLVRDFDWAIEWLKEGNSTKPTEKQYEEVKNKLVHKEYDQSKTYAILTRNLINKQPIHNTHIEYPELETLMRYLIDGGLTIINVGFPPAQYSIDSNQYIELSYPTLQDDIPALFYTTNGTLLFGSAFPFHSFYNMDIFLLESIWSGPRKDREMMFNARNSNTNMSSVDLSSYVKTKDYANIKKALLNHKKMTKNTFDKGVPITVLNGENI